MKNGYSYYKEDKKTNTLYYINFLCLLRVEHVNDASEAHLRDTNENIELNQFFTTVYFVVAGTKQI